MRFFTASRTPHRTPIPTPSRAEARRSGGRHGVWPSLVAAAALAACGGGDDTSTPPAPAAGTVAVTAALGVVINADVSVTCAPSGLVLGTGSTGAQGTVNVSTSGSCSGPVLVSVRGRSDGSST